MTRAAVTGCTSDFTIGALALLRSLTRHHPDVKRICFSPEDQVSAVQSTLGVLAEVRPIPRRLNNSPDDPKTLVSWSRVFLPTLDADVAVWFDADVLVCRPAPEWWQVPPGKVNAVTDRAYRIKHMVPQGMEAWYFLRFPIDRERRGFNAGVFALRPADFAELPERFETLLEDQYVEMQPFAFDQGLLNGLLLERVQFLGSAYNAHCLAECRVPWNVRVIHYTGKPKPWAADYDRSTMGYYYWLRDGEGEQDEEKLRQVKKRARLSSPKRFAYKVLRKTGNLLGLWPEEKGIGRRPQ